tara:strand:+ start:49622 stop:49873 length:252 start_codon:yes stop_codon:yes gene_type:complete
MWFRKNIKLKEVENNEQIIKNNEIGLVSLLIVLLKLTSNNPIRNAPKIGIAGISQEIFKRNGIEIQEETCQIDSSSTAIKVKE